MTDELWDPEPDEEDDGERYAVLLPWSEHYREYSRSEYQVLEHWWLEEMKDYSTADLEGELAYISGELIALQLTTDVAQGLIDGVQYEPINKSRAAWLVREIKRRQTLPPMKPRPAGARIDASFVRDLKDRLDLPGFLGGPPFNFPDLKRSGATYTATCPYHTERTPSFVVYRDHWHCFSCAQSGDVFDLLIVSSTCRTWRAAVEYVANVVGVAMPKAPEPVRVARAPDGGVQPIWSKYTT